MDPEPVIESLRDAVAAMPDDVPLRLHLASLLLRAGQRDEAVRHLGAVLQRDPGNGRRWPCSPAGEAGGQPFGRTQRAACQFRQTRTVATSRDSAPPPWQPDPADGDSAPEPDADARRHGQL